LKRKTLGNTGRFRFCQTAALGNFNAQHGKGPYQMFSRTFNLPFGYTATFFFPPGDVCWAPDFPRIRQRRARRKFFAAYQAARRSFSEEVAVVVGGSVMIVDSPDLQTVIGTEVIHEPTRH
jgi:hypothetical protein